MTTSRPSKPDGLPVPPRPRAAGAVRWPISPPRSPIERTASTMPATRNRPSQLSVLRYGAFVSRTADQRVTSFPPPVRSRVHDPFGRRPLGAVTIILTKPHLLLSLANEAQGEAAGVPENTWKSVGVQQSIIGKPKEFRVATVIAPKGAMWM